MIKAKAIYRQMPWHIFSSERMATTLQRVLHISYHRIYPVEYRMFQPIQVVSDDYA
jgi:hypothetical protein